MQAVQRAGRLVAMNLAELAQAQRQVAVTLQPLVEDLDVPGAIHRLDGIDPLVRRLRHVHVLAELLDVPGLHPQLAVHDLRRVHFLVAGLALPLPHVADQLLEQRPALRVPEHGARALPPGSGTGRVPCRCGGDRASPPPRAGAGSPSATSRRPRRCRRSAASISLRESPRQ